MGDYRKVRGDIQKSVEHALFHRRGTGIPIKRKQACPHHTDV